MVWVAALTHAADTAAQSTLTAYGPILVATAGLITALVAALSRKDKRNNDAMAAADNHTNTAIRGLTEAYDRVEAERAREQLARMAAEKLAQDRQERIERLEEELEDCRRRNGRRQPNGQGTR